MKTVTRKGIHTYRSYLYIKKGAEVNRGRVEEGEKKKEGWKCKEVERGEKKLTDFATLL